MFYLEIKEMVDDVFGADLMTQAVKYLDVTADNAYYKDAFSIVDGFYSKLLPVGMALVITYFFLELIDSATKDNFTVEHFARSLIKLVLASVLIQNADSIFNSIMTIGYQLMNSLLLNVTNNGNGTVSVDYGMMDTETITKSLGATPTGFFSNLAVLMKLLVPWLLSLLVQVGVIFTCVGRALDLMLKCTFAPIGIADLFTDGLRSSGVRYIKGFFASCASAAVMVAALKVGCTIQNSILHAEGSGAFSSLIGVFTIVVFQAATLSLVMKSQSLAKELIG